MLVCKSIFCEAGVVLNVIICDDDVNYCEILSKKVNKVLKISFNTSANSVCLNSLDKLADYLKNNTADMIFLDIMFGSLNAVDWALENIKEHCSEIIFMTFFPAEAYNIFETGCAYYLIKGKFTDEQLANAIKKALCDHNTDNPDVAIVKYASKNIAVNYKDITHIESYNNNIILHFADSSTTILYMTLKSFLKELPGYFVQCHKSFIVNLSKITACSPYEITVSGGTAIPVPRKKYKQFVEKYEKYMDLKV